MNLDTITLTIGGTYGTERLPASDLPESTIRRLLEYGTRLCNDYVNARAHTLREAMLDEGASQADVKVAVALEKEAAFAVWLERAKAGTLGDRTQRASRVVDPVEVECIAIVVARLRSLAGMKAKDAKAAIASLGWEELASRLATATKADPTSYVAEIRAAAEASSLAKSMTSGVAIDLTALGLDEG